MKESIKSNRLASLDILRGLDLWLLLMIGPVLHTFLRCGYGENWEFIRFHAELRVIEISCNIGLPSKLLLI